MIFVIGPDDKGNVIVKCTSSVGKSDQPIVWTERVPPQIREMARTVKKVAETGQSYLPLKTQKAYG